MSVGRGIVVFSGGSAANNLVDVFEKVRESKSCLLNYVIPISDNGGSTSELIRMFGGPGIGDVRSRLVRLIPTDPPSSERSAIAHLFNHRLPSTSSKEAHVEWYTIVDGTSSLWTNIPAAKKELIRSFLNTVNLEILKRARPPISTFDFTSASVGNLFLTGARLFSGSFESAIYLLGSICGIPDDIVRVIPAINSNFSHHISAGLANGDTIVGQNNISHPSEATALDALSPGTKNRAKRLSLEEGEAEDATLPGSLPTLKRQNIKFSKDHEEDLPARIERIWYINPYGQEIRPPVNLRVVEAIQNSQAIIYSIGSLYTSLIPSIVLRGVGQALKSSPAKHKVLILNGSLDREVGPSAHPFTAVNFVEAIARAAEESQGHQWDGASSLGERMKAVGEVQQRLTVSTDHVMTPVSSQLKQYVTYVIYLEGEGSPKVDRQQLLDHGIESVRLYGRKIEADGPEGQLVMKGMKYDSQALIGALETILGKKGDAVVGTKSRRNTLEN
ncbi:MAG: hypothetical protein Q9160_007188 [Pyrenula sp. 1 TL-2023]